MKQLHKEINTVKDEMGKVKKELKAEYEKEIKTLKEKQITLDEEAKPVIEKYLNLYQTKTPEYTYRQLGANSRITIAEQCRIMFSYGDPYESISNTKDKEILDGCRKNGQALTNLQKKLDNLTHKE